MNDKILKNKLKNHNKHTVMYPCMKFQSFCGTSDYETKFAQKNMTDKSFEKINIKVVINI